VFNFKQTSLDEATDPWGVKVERVEVYVHYLAFLGFTLFWIKPSHVHKLVLLLSVKTSGYTEFPCWSCPGCKQYCKFLFPIPKIFHVSIVLCLFDMYRKDVRLPQQLQRAMAAEAEASREARAKVQLIGFSLQSL